MRSSVPGFSAKVPFGGNNFEHFSFGPYDRPAPRENVCLRRNRNGRFIRSRLLFGEGHRHVLFIEQAAESAGLEARKAWARQAKRVLHPMASRLCGFALLLQVCAAFKFDSIDGLGGGKPCKPFSCSGGHGAVPKRPMALTSQGCHGMGGAMFSGAGMGGSGPKPSDAVLTPCCDQFHACAQICGAPKTRCDKNLKKCIAEGCASLDDAAKKECEQTGNLHVMMVQLGGCKRYEEAQSAACDCVKEERVHKRRVQSLTDFFSAHSRDKLGNVAKLCKKHGEADGWKFSKLLGRMVAKYPASIKHVKSREQAMMDEILKGGGLGDPGSNDDLGHLGGLRKPHEMEAPDVTGAPGPEDAEDDTEEDAEVDLDAENEENAAGEGHDEM